MRKFLFTKNLAIFGTLIVWIPILLPIILSVASLVSGKSFNFDFLMPTELFPVILSGGILLILTAFLVKSNRIAVSVGFGIAILCLVGSQVAAVMTGLASGENEPTGPAYLIVTAFIGVYNFSIIALGIAGISLIRKLNQLPQVEDIESAE